MLMMLVAGVACVWSGLAHAQPTSCNDDAQCSTGMYCGATSCLSCRSCGDLNRDPPHMPTACVKSITECGACYEGLVADLADGGCVPERLGGGGTSPYVWIGVAVALAVLLLAAVSFFIYVWRRPDTFRFIGASASVHIPKEASAPPPPVMPPDILQPSNVHPPSVRPTNLHLPNMEPMIIESPPPSYAQCDPLSHGEGEESLLLKKPQEPSEPLRGVARESAGHQVARPFAPPNYVRPPPTPEQHSGDTVMYDDETRPSRVPFVYHDEETVPSEWRPAGDEPHDDSNNATITDTNEPENAIGLPHQALVALRRPSHSDHGPPAKILCVDQDTNNNRSSDASSSDDGASAPGARHASNTILVNVNLLQQVNNFKGT